MGRCSSAQVSASTIWQSKNPNAASGHCGFFFAWAHVVQHRVPASMIWQPKNQMLLPGIAIFSTWSRERHFKLFLLS
ncbi:hypothetical protein DUNSADRAFT_12535 [Dunaliella salina]|uniref:Encoded protein n=1 Tax=Dunaliella salina TaxID=3046 RepID=A0ABQ7GB43_DUNSA|nr:hypothetical protein DUNSADRAFT_12535 [Dunaliella salina]|eukprot:KAF5831821.1 hypothetical protein DUNSADRAFT_12535 [Dunaliella salina]